MSIKPILFNTDMVRAILDGRKTVTRRVIKFEKVFNGDAEKVYPGKCALGVGVFNKFDNMRVSKKPPYQPGDILYVRETWRYIDFTGEDDGYVYKASQNGTDWEENTDNWKWRPSIHMPKEAARIWLKVTNVRVERLKDITIGECEKEGVYCGNNGDIFAFMHLWDSTVKKEDINRYAWRVNPWVWVIEFERCEKPQEDKK